MADNDSKPRFHREPPCLHIDKLLNLTFNLCNQTGYTFYKAAEFARDYEIENGIEEHHAKIRMFATLYAAAPWHAQGERSEKQIIEISAPVIDTIVSVPQEPLKHEWSRILAANGFHHRTSTRDMNTIGTPLMFNALSSDSI